MSMEGRNEVPVLHGNAFSLSARVEKTPEFVQSVLPNRAFKKGHERPRKWSENYQPTIHPVGRRKYTTG